MSQEMLEALYKVSEKLDGLRGAVTDKFDDLQGTMERTVPKNTLDAINKVTGKLDDLKETMEQMACKNPEETGMAGLGLVNCMQPQGWGFVTVQFPAYVHNRGGGHIYPYSIDIKVPHKMTMDDFHQYVDAKLFEGTQHSRWKAKTQLWFGCLELSKETSASLYSLGVWYLEGQATIDCRIVGSTDC